MAGKTKGADRVAKLHEQLTEAVGQLATSEDWQRWLDVAARFHTYSAYNTFLILMQRPDATRVAGYRTWQGLGRQVRKGERSLAILAPRFRNQEDEDTGETVRRLVGFHPVSVFDISQTEGEPLPTPPTLVERVEGDSPAGLWDALVAQAADAGFSVETGTAEEIGHPEAYGVCRTTEGRVIVRADLPAAMAAKTLAHELSHGLLHGPQADVSRARAEVEAESVAYIVCEAVGLRTEGYSFGYVTAWSHGDTDAVQATAQRVMDTAQAILAHIEPHTDEAQLASA